ncbi:MAG TPA: DUF2299 family protein [Gemmatimonadales bacterium]|nr:DUF2299 family protein [Gemmatimonadales bacterium]
MSGDLKAKVQGWLKTIGLTPVDQNDPQAVWHLAIDYPVRSGHQLHLVSPKDHPSAVVVVSGTEVSHEHREAFDKLDDDGKDEFLWEFRRTINSVHVDFGLKGAEGPLDCPSHFQITSTRYEDGLTLDSFAQTLGAVFKTELAAIWVIQRHLAPRSFGGGRFDFRRLGA